MQPQQRNFKISVRWTILSIVLLLLLGLFVANHMVRTQVRDSGEWLESHDETEQHAEATKAALETLIEYRFWVSELTNAVLFRDQERISLGIQKVGEFELILIARLKGLPAISQTKRLSLVALVDRIRLLEDEELTALRAGALRLGGEKLQEVNETIERLKRSLERLAEDQDRILYAQYETMEEQLEELVDLSKWIVAVGIVGAAIVAWVLVAWVFRPLGQISSALDQLSRGETQVSVPRSKMAELDSLAITVQRFAEQRARTSAAEIGARESEERFRDFAQAAGDWFWEADPQHRVTFLSEKFTDIFGIDVSDYLGKTRWEVNERYEGDEGAKKWEEHRKIVNAQKPFRNFVFRLEIPHLQPSSRDVSISGRPRFDQDGRFLGYRGSGSDVTEIAAIERAHLEARREAEEANRSKSIFLANMSHELRTPINAINGFSEIMSLQLMGELPERYRGYAGDIHQSSQHLMKLIDDLLDMSKIDAGKMELMSEPVDIGTLVKEAVRLVSEAAKDAGCHLTISQDHPMKWEVDRLRVKQILLNLLSNAIKFSPNGRIEIKLSLEGRQPTLIVKDTGIGMTKEGLERALSRFGQAEHKAYEVNHQGTGLGLYISKELAELHGGSLSIESEPGVGTVVTVRFPADRLVLTSAGRSSVAS